MKYFLPVLLLAMLSPVSRAQDAKAYPVTVHVLSSQRYGGRQALDVDIDGNGYQLVGPLGKHGLLELGDYQAKLVTDERRSKEWKMVYELVLPEQKTRKFLVTRKSAYGAVFIPIAPGAADAAAASHVAQSQTPTATPPKHD
jgi:hypothetical protein